ncbi:MAG: hypothetical protein KatS3mg119_0463 [Rhodothalassiaceae bacterium]|nr:MAG: hypothetical protein KatS3mg119_0463 [Rhodothalassiaceae bacterium]
MTSRQSKPADLSAAQRRSAAARDGRGPTCKRYSRLSGRGQDAGLEIADEIARARLEPPPEGLDIGPASQRHELQPPGSARRRLLVRAAGHARPRARQLGRGHGLLHGGLRPAGDLEAGGRPRHPQIGGDGIAGEPLALPVGEREPVLGGRQARARRLGEPADRLESCGLVGARILEQQHRQTIGGHRLARIRRLAQQRQRLPAVARQAAQAVEVQGGKIVERTRIAGGGQLLPYRPRLGDPPGAVELQRPGRARSRVRSPRRRLVHPGPHRARHQRERGKQQQEADRSLHILGNSRSFA